MKTHTPKSVKELLPSTKLQTFQATLTKLYEAVTRDGQYGPYTFQDGEFEHEGETIHAKFKFAVPMDRRGQFVTIQTGTDKKGNPAGVSFELDKYRNKQGEPVEKQVVLVTPAAKLTWGNDSAPAQPADDEIPGLESPAPAPAASGVDAVKLSIHKRANLYELCLSRAVQTVPLFERLTGEQMTPEQFQGYVGMLVIEGLRQGEHNKLPTDIKPHIKALAEVPHDDPQA